MLVLTKLTISNPNNPEANPPFPTDTLPGLEVPMKVEDKDELNPYKFMFLF